MKLFNKNKIKLILSLIMLTASFSLVIAERVSWAQVPLAQKLQGKILLQVEDNGEAWYINPTDRKRYYMGRPADAFSLMKDLSLGISNEDLNNIPVAEANFIDVDTDNDGLSDRIEAGLGTDINKADTDDDGYDDKIEILAHFNPVGAGAYTKDEEKIKRLAGTIVLQVEANGEAWYINPDDKKRYYMGKPLDAFNLMRSLGLGITNENLAMIESSEINPEYQPEQIVKNYTTPVMPKNPEIKIITERKYNDPNNKFSFVYPSGWTIKKFGGNPNSTQITHAQKDFIIEQKGVITLDYFTSENPINQIDKFKIASKGKASALSNSEITVSGKDAYENSFRLDITYEKSTTIQISPTEFLAVTLITAKHNDTYYNGIYDNLLNSLEFP